MSSVISVDMRKSADSIVANLFSEGMNPLHLLRMHGLAGCVRCARPVGCDRDYLIAITARQGMKVINT
jgi:hypothetical protein